MEWILLLAALYLLTRRWFWALVVFFAGLAALFAMLASIFHFQILGAMGFFVLLVICGAILQDILEGGG